MRVLRTSAPIEIMESIGLIAFWCFLLSESIIGFLPFKIKDYDSVLGIVDIIPLLTTWLVVMIIDYVSYNFCVLYYW